MKRIALIISVIFLFQILYAANFHDVIINEFNTEVNGGTVNSGQNALIELKNNISTTVTVNTWTLEFMPPYKQFGITAETYSMTITIGDLLPGEYKVITVSSDTPFSGASARKDGGFYILKDQNGNVIDKVYYGTWGKAPDPGVDTKNNTNPFSCERVAFTGNDAYDWEWQEHPTWGAANSHTQQPPLGQDVVINEVYLKEQDSNSYIELYNKSSNSINISGWKIVVDTIAATIPASTILNPHQFYVITEDLSKYSNNNTAVSSVDYFDTSTFILVDNNGRRHDQFGWENLSSTGEDFSRVMDGTGGNYDGYNRETCNFIEGLPQTKGKSNVPYDAVRLNEIELKTDRTFAVEFKNTWTYSIDLKGYKLNGATINNDITIDTSTYLVLTSSDFDTPLESVINTGGGTISFTTPDGAVATSFSYGYEGMAPDFVPGTSIGYTFVGSPTGDDFAEWTIDFTPTMGSQNDCFIAHRWNGIVINEVNPHAGSSFIEIYNNTGGQYNIGNMKVVVDNVYTIPAGTVLDTGAYYVIEESSYPTGFNLTTIDGQKHNNVYLYDDTGVRVNQLGWETLCPYSNNSLQRDDDHPENWKADGYNMFTSGITCDDDSKGFKNVPNCNYDTTPPDWQVPGQSNIKAVGGYYKISLSWDRAIDTENSVLYDVYRSVNDTSTFNPIAQDVTTNTYVDTTVNIGTTYYYKIETHNCFGLSKMANDITSAFANAYTIKDLRQNDKDGVPIFNGVNVHDIEGYVNVDSGIFQNGKLSIFIQKDGYGINIFGFSAPSPVDKYKVGDLIRVKGQVTSYNGLTEIKISNDSDIQVVSTGNTVTPKVVKISGTNWEEKEGVLVTVRGYITDKIQIYAPNSGYFYLTDGFGKIEVYCSSYDNTNIDLNALHLDYGQYVEITGIIVQYDKTRPYTSGFELKPRSQNDIKILTGAVNYNNEGLSDSVIYPQRGDKTTITFNADLGSHVVIRIYNLQGILKKTLFDGNVGSSQFIYDGTDDDGNYLTPGSYIVNITIQSGNKTTSKNYPLIIAVPLK